MTTNNQNQPIIIGIDHGYGNIKTAHCVFKTGVTAYDKEPIFKSNLLTYKGCYYIIGEEHKEFMSNIFTTTVRLNLDKEDDRRAYEYLRHMDKAQHHSYSKTIVAAVNAFFSRQEKAQSDPLWKLEEHLLERIEQTVRRCLQENPLLGIVPLLQNTATLPESAPDTVQKKGSDEAPDLSVALDFINNL